MDRHSSTAAAAPSIAAAATAGPFPVARPHRTAATTIPVQITAIAIATRLLFPPPIYMARPTVPFLFFQLCPFAERASLFSIFR